MTIMIHSRNLLLRLRSIRLLPDRPARASLIEFLGLILLVLGLFTIWPPLGFLGAGGLAIFVAQGVSHDTS